MQFVGDFLWKQKKVYEDQAAEVVQRRPRNRATHTRLSKAGDQSVDESIANLKILRGQAIRKPLSNAAMKKLPWEATTQHMSLKSGL